MASSPAKSLAFAATSLVAVAALNTTARAESNQFPSRYHETAHFLCVEAQTAEHSVHLAADTLARELGNEQAATLAKLGPKGIPFLIGLARTTSNPYAQEAAEVLRQNAKRMAKLTGECRHTMATANYKAEQAQIAGTNEWWQQNRVGEMASAFTR